MKRSRKIYAAGAAAFGLGFSACLGFMTASFPVEYLGVTAVTSDLPVLVIDAGHGGFDGGAEAADGTQEKNINLAIAQNLERLAKDYQVEVVMTRDGDYGLYEEDSSTKKREDLLNRKRIMEESEADLAVSIHLNSFPQDTSVCGAQVFYSPDEQEQTGVLSSREVAEAVQKSLEINITDGRERTVMKKNDVLLLQNPPCPFILVECGFLSSPQEAEQLKTVEFQAKLAEAIWQGINEKLCLRVKKNVPVIDSANNQ
ncbi:MAG: N-acetylmuramoyl-L-alanine amidase [Firmicutes bacterium]|nr:N-acetylmuramoyl-L-alanine amidase [Bacillota bacterium]